MTTKQKQQLSVFNFNGQALTVLDDGNQPWFVAKEVCAALGIVKDRDAISRLDDDERGSVKLDTLGGIQSVNAINESGLYSLTLTSNKPEAKVFKKWITSEVLPAIRKTGAYRIPENTDLFGNGGTVKKTKYLTVDAISKIERLIEKTHGELDSEKRHSYFDLLAATCNQYNIPVSLSRDLPKPIEHPLLVQFWQVIDELNINHDLNHSNHPHTELALNIGHLYRRCKEQKLTLPEFSLIKPLLANSHRPLVSVKPVFSRKLKSTLRCWIFNTNNN